MALNFITVNLQIMKRLFLAILTFASTLAGHAQTMQASLKAGTTAGVLDVYMKSSGSFSLKDEAATITIAVPATVTRNRCSRRIVHT